jgi:ATP-dependent RNA circularization protein (DNA/RNA ligase family)
MNDSFFKFPSTPHLKVISSFIVRDDKVLSEEEKHKFLSYELIIEEKIDGANLGISFNNSGNVLLQNRGSYLQEPYNGQWKELYSWIMRKEDKLIDVLEDRYILFGEWCYARHSVLYDLLPDWFLGFDIYDKNTERFLSCKRRDIYLQELNIYSVPFLEKGFFTERELVSMMSVSAYGNTPSEGLYIRIDNDDWNISRAKLVRPDFLQSIDSHWSGKVLVKNKLLSR